MPVEFKDSAQKSDGLPWRDLSMILRFRLAAAVIARISCPKRLYQPTVLSCIFFQLFEYEFLLIFLLDTFGLYFFPLFQCLCSLFASHVVSLLPSLHLMFTLSLSPSLALSISLSVSLAPSLSLLSLSPSLSRFLARSLVHSLSFFVACSLSLSLSLILSLSS